jgi:hypothetical protein
MEVRDIDRTVELLGEALNDWAHTGAQLLGPIEEWDLGPQVPKRRVAQVKDPDGMRIDIYQPERTFFTQRPTA